MSRRLERLLHPRTLAAFGGREAATVVAQCDRMGFAGEIWPVHPTRKEIGGRRCFASVAQLPEAPDAAFVGVNRHATVAIVRELAERGAGGAVCYASGFRESQSETGDGASLEEDLLNVAGAMPILGPNCYGLINYLDGALLWPDQHGGIRTQQGVAIITQSSNIALNMTMQRRALPIAYLLTAGNQAQTGLAEIAEGLLDDPRVSALGLHIEGLGDVAAFQRMAAKARRLGKPVVALKMGCTEQARAAALSHTASLAGSDVATDVLLRRCGVARLRSIPQFLETLKLLHVHGALPGAELCSISCSGGEAVLMADAAAGRQVRFRPLRAEEQARVKATLNEIVRVDNPLDYHTFIWGDLEASISTFSAMLESGFDLSLLVVDFPRQDRCDDTAWNATVSAICTAAQRTGGRTAVVASLPENLPEARAQVLLDQGLVPLCGIDEALAAVEAAAFIGKAWGEPEPTMVLACPEESGTVLSLNESLAKQRLTASGLTVPQGRTVSAAGEAVAAAETIGFPVAIKALGIAHKSEANAVRVNLHDAASVRLAAEELAERGDGLLVERMIEGAIMELIVGVTRDTECGLLMTVGAGGLLVELLQDSVSMLLPVTEHDVRRALRSLRLAPVLDGYRGAPAADVDALVDAVLAIAQFARDNADRLEELDVNPLMVCAKGRGAVAADVLIRMRGE